MNEKRYRRLAVCKRFSVIVNFVIGRMVLAGLICLPHLALLIIVLIATDGIGVRL